MVCESPSGLALGRAGCRLAAVSHRPDGQGREDDVRGDGMHRRCVRTSDGMNWNLHDLVYEALSEEWDANIFKRGRLLRNAGRLF